MRLLLDTHIALACIQRQTGSLPTAMTDAIDQPENTIWVSVVTIWEIAIKSRLGKLPIKFDMTLLPELLHRMGFGVLPIYAQHVLADINPIPGHKDPFDRLFLGICAAEGMRLVTKDRALADHPLAWRPLPS